MLRFTILVLCLFPLVLSAQYNASPSFYPGDSIIVNVSKSFGKIYTHEIKAKETVYSLSGTFGLKPNDIVAVNPDINLNLISIGQDVNVPFVSTIMIKHPSHINPANPYIPVYYKAKPKDNLFRIARIYFDQSIENLLELNQTENFDIKVGQMVLVGWLPLNENELFEEKPLVESENTVRTQDIEPNADEVFVQEDIEVEMEAESEDDEKKNSGFFSKLKKTFGFKNKKEENEIKEVVDLSKELKKEESVTNTEKIPDNQNVESSEQTIKVNDEPTNSESPYSDPRIKFEKKINENEPSGIGEVPDVTKPDIVYKHQKGIAIWNQSSPDTKNLFALHPTADVGSYIEITNPMMNKTVHAKVVGNIPPRTYTDDVSIVVSPRVADMLGAVDKRFMVKLKYHE